MIVEQHALDNCGMVSIRHLGFCDQLHKEEFVRLFNNLCDYASETHGKGVIITTGSTQDKWCTFLRKCGFEMVHEWLNQNYPKRTKATTKIWVKTSLSTNKINIEDL